MSIINDALRKVERDKKKSPPPENSSAHPLAGADVSPRGKGRFSLFSFFKGKNLVGIDMGASAIKCVRLSKRGGGYILAEFACERVSPGATGNEMSHALKTIVARQGLENACVASTIDAKSLSLSHITLPKMPAADLAEAVRWEVRKEIDFPDDAIIDFTVNDEIVEEGKKKLLIQTFAVEKEEVMAHVGMLKEASLRPYVVDVCPMALLAAYDYNYGWNDKKRYALIDIGASKTTLAIIHKKKLRLSRNIPVAGNDITWAVQESEEIDFMAAQEKVIAASANPEAAPVTVRHAINRFIDDIATEIERSFLYYSAQLREGGIDAILISGGCSLIAGLSERIEAVAGVPTSVYDSLRGLDVKDSAAGGRDLLSLSPLLIKAFGLALRRRGND